MPLVPQQRRPQQPALPPPTSTGTAYGAARDTEHLASWHPDQRRRLPPYPPGSFLGGLTPPQIDDLWRHLHPVYLRVGAAIDLTPSRVLYLILDGLVKETPAIGGAMHTTLRLRGDLVESSSVFDLHGRSVTVHAVRPALLGAMPRSIFRRLLIGSPPALTALARSMAHREKRDAFFNVHVRSGDTATRMARYLCFLADTLGDTHSSTSERGIIGFTQTDIAQAVSASRTSAEGFFRDQRDTGVLSTSYRTIHIHNMTALRRLVGDMPTWRG